MSQKAERRLQALEKLTMSLEEKEQIKKVLDLPYMSSDEEDEDGVNRKTRCLTWESTRLTNIKQNLDTAFMNTIATPKMKRLMVKSSIGNIRSERPCPPNAPEWACKKN